MADDLDKNYLTEDNFTTRFSEYAKDMTMLSGYMWAVTVLMPAFKKMAEAAQNFDDFKKDVLDLANQQIELRDNLHDAQYNDPDKYGLPVDYKGRTLD